MITEWFRRRNESKSLEKNQILWRQHLAYLEKTYPRKGFAGFITPEDLERLTRPTANIKQWVFLGDDNLTGK